MTKKQIGKRSINIGGINYSLIHLFRTAICWAEGSNTSSIAYFILC